jgi:hypothetical protein
VRFAESKAVLHGPHRGVRRDVRHDVSDGSTGEHLRPTNETFHVGDAWEPTLIREGVASTRPSREGAQHELQLPHRLRHAPEPLQRLSPLDRQPRDPGDRVPVRYQTFYEEGIESTLTATVRLPGAIVYSTDVELFADFQTLDQLSVNWRNTLSLRIARNLSFNVYATSSASR